MPVPTDEAYIGGPAGQAILTAEAQTGRPLSEDCLSLNVWTKPQSGTGAPKAVLFWIFGGGETSPDISDPQQQQQHALFRGHQLTRGRSRRLLHREYGVRDL